MTPDIVTNAIVAALSAGAITASADTAKSPVAEAYQELKSLIRNKFGEDSEAAAALDQLEAKPDSEAREKLLTEELRTVKAVSDSELTSAVESLLKLIQPPPDGKRSNQFAEGTGIAQADRGGTATVRMAALEEMTDYPEQGAVGTGIAQAFGEGASATVTITGFRSEEVASLMQAALQAAGAAQQARIEELAARLNTSREAVLGFFKILQEGEVPVEQLATKLTLIAQRHVSMLERLAGLDPEDDVASSYIEEARKLLGRASSSTDYDRADELLFNAEEKQDHNLRRAEALEREAQQVGSRLRYSISATRIERAELSLTRLDYLQAAHHFHFAADLVATDDPSLKLTRLARSAQALALHGYEKGENISLANAIALYQEVLKERTRERVPLEWAMTQNSLGNVLRALGEREGGVALLEEALTAFREALKVQTCEVAPLDWAMTQRNLGNVLWTMGEGEGGTWRLEEAMFAYREALKVLTRERTPLEWGITQTNLGNVFRALGEREGGSGWLEQAIAAYRDALRELTRERLPLAWAATQNSLGVTLWKLGAQGEATERLEEAIAAYREALKEQTRERVPLDWAVAQNNLGIAFWTLGLRKDGTALLEQAIAAHRNALQELTRERAPLDWAATQNNLGNALRTLGERKTSTSQLEEAVAAYREALKEQTRERVPLDWIRTQNNLGKALLKWGQREKGTVRLKEASAAFRQALGEQTCLGVNDSQLEGWLEALDQFIAERASADIPLEE
jgi:hypothetical protein